MRKKAGILMIGIILILEGILIPHIFIEKAQSNAIGNTASQTDKADSAKQNVPENYTSVSNNTINTTAENAAQEDTKNSKSSAKKIAKAKKIYKRNKKILVLVNADHALDESYQANLQPICKGRLSASACLYDSLVQMFADAAEEGFSYWIASAWRSREKQQKLIDEDVRSAMQRGLSYEDALAETYKETMPAGHSEHETGLALDILCSGNMNMDASQAEEPGNIWLRENCFRYGFIFRYPKEKEEITGVNYEPWHLRYVGKEAAAFLKKHDLTLEEYWQLL